MIPIRKASLEYQNKLEVKNPTSDLLFSNYRYHFVYYIKQYEPEKKEEVEFDIPIKRDFFVVHFNTIEEYLFMMTLGLSSSKLINGFSFEREKFFNSNEFKNLVKTKNTSILNIVKYIENFVNSALKKDSIQFHKQIIMSQSILYLQAEKDIKKLVDEYKKIELPQKIKKGCLLPFDVKITKIHKAPVSYLPFSITGEVNYDNIVFPKKAEIPAGSLIVDGSFSYEPISKIEKSSLIKKLVEYTDETFLDIFNYSSTLDFDDINNYYTFGKEFWKTLKQIKNQSSIPSDKEFMQRINSFKEYKAQNKKRKEVVKC